MPRRRHFQAPATSPRRKSFERWQAGRQQQAESAWILKNPAWILKTGSGGVVFAGVVTERSEKRLLLSGRHNVDSVPSADLFAEQASDASLFVDLHLAEIDRRVFRRRRDAIERAYVDAHAASLAVVGMDDGDRSFGALEHVGYIAVGVHRHVDVANR